MWFELLTSECAEMWESWRIDSFSNGKLLYVSKRDV